MSLLNIKNYHADEFSLTPERGDWTAYFENQYGEQLIYHQKKGEATATLYHGDNGWQPALVKDGICPALVLDSHEMMWLAAVWQAANEHRLWKEKQK